MKTSTRNYILLFLGIIILSGIVFATTINERGISNNFQLNDSGVFYSNVKDTSVIKVCRGTSLANDLINIFFCNYNCASTDNDCSQEIQSALNNQGNIIIEKGNYPIPITSSGFVISFTKNNTYLYGNGATLNFSVSTGTSFDSLVINGLNDIKITGLKMISNNAYGSACTIACDCVGLYVLNSKDIYLDNIEISNFKCFQVFVNSNGNLVTDNVNIYNSRFQGVGTNDVIGGGPAVSTSIVSNINIYNNLVNQTNISGNYGGAIDLVGTDGSKWFNNLVYGVISFGGETKGTTNGIINNNIVYPIDFDTGGVINSGNETSNNLIFSNNIIKDGFAYFYGNNLVVKDNIINNPSNYDNGFDLTLYNTNNAIVDGNYISYGVRGIIATGEKNNIINNRIQGLDSGSGIAITSDTSNNNSIISNNEVIINSGDTLQNVFYIATNTNGNNMISNTIYNFGTISNDGFFISAYGTNNTARYNQLIGNIPSNAVAETGYTNYVEGFNYGATGLPICNHISRTFILENNTASYYCNGVSWNALY